MRKTRRLTPVQVFGLIMVATSFAVYCHAFYRQGKVVPSWLLPYALLGGVLALFEVYRDVLDYMYRPMERKLCYVDRNDVTWIVLVHQTIEGWFLAPDTPEDRFLSRATPSEVSNPEIQNIRNYHMLDGDRGIHYLGYEYVFKE